MKENHTLALIVAYYFSKFDSKAVAVLGYSSAANAFKSIGAILGVKSSSVKNMRDEFDPIHENGRVGWYQTPLRPSRAKVVEAFGDLGEEAMREVVREILDHPPLAHSPDLKSIVASITTHDSTKTPGVFVMRGPTGRKAEEFFLRQFENKVVPFTGQLSDCRDLGCGYDFKINAPEQETFIEVKGLDGIVGGVSFTAKEWAVARKIGARYVLVIIRNVGSQPEMSFIQDPANSLSAKRVVFTTIQVRWEVRSVP